jgi:Ca2+-binding RTX toxin-like protein
VYGGLGLDSLTGGADVFNTTLGTSNKDTITDFNVVDDTMHLAKSVMSALKFNQVAENAFRSSPIGTNHSATDRILYNKNTGLLSYDADGNNGGTAIEIALLNTGLNLTYQDFWVILA